MFVSRKLVFRKPFSKLSCVCLPLEKLINRKYFPVNGKQFPVNGKHFPVKEKFGLISRKVFSLLAVFVFQKVVSGKQLFKLSYVQTFLCLFVIRKVGQRKTLSSQRKIWAENIFRKL